MSQEGQAIDIKALQDELETLKTSYTDLQGRYSQLEEQHNTYKLDIEFNRDIADVTRSLKDNEVETLKTLKASGNEQAYNMLLDNLKSTPTNTGGLGNFSRGFSSSSQQEENKANSVDDFTQAINEMKGGN